MIGTDNNFNYFLNPPRIVFVFDWTSIIKKGTIIVSYLKGVMMSEYKIVQNLITYETYIECPPMYWEQVQEQALRGELPQPAPIGDPMFYPNSQQYSPLATIAEWELDALLYASVNKCNV